MSLSPRANAAPAIPANPAIVVRRLSASSEACRVSTRWTVDTARTIAANRFCVACAPTSLFSTGCRTTNRNPADVEPRSFPVFPGPSGFGDPGSWRTASTTALSANRTGTTATTARVPNRPANTPANSAPAAAAMAESVSSRLRVRSIRSARPARTVA
jgi:hypothetical protein